MGRAPGLSDSHGRVMRDLRVSLTDRCNFRCLYLPSRNGGSGEFLPVQIRRDSQSRPLATANSRVETPGTNPDL